MVGWVFGAAGFAVLLLLVVAVSHRSLNQAGRPSSGTADAFGNFIDVFDPGQARADRELKSHDNQATIIPSPDDEDPRMRIIDSGGRRVVRIRRHLTPPVAPPVRRDD